MARDDQRDHFDAPERHGHAGQRVRALRCETNLARPQRLSCAEAHEAPPQTRILEVLAEAVRVVSSALVRTHDSLAVAGCKYAGGRALMAWAREPRIYLPIPVVNRDARHAPRPWPSCMALRQWPWLCLPGGRAWIMGPKRHDRPARARSVRARHSGGLAPLTRHPDG
jgi:hypothetical protein